MIRYESWMTVSIIPCSFMAALNLSASSSDNGLGFHCIWFFENICMQSQVSARPRSGALYTPPDIGTWAPRSIVITVRISHYRVDKPLAQPSTAQVGFFMRSAERHRFGCQYGLRLTSALSMPKTQF